MTVRSQQSPNAFPEKCLVTGAGGFIGNALCSELRRRGATIHGCGRTAPAGASIDVSHQCDVSALWEVRQIIDEVRPAVVFHCASKVTGARELEAVMPTFYDNLVGAVNILQAATETGDIRVVQLGSLQEPDEPTSQGIAPSPYAASKLAASAYTRMFAELYALPASVARVFMVYGPGQLDFAKLIP
jgi:UDP-glucose 4-epimerase